MTRILLPVYGGKEGKKGQWSPYQSSFCPGWGLPTEERENYHQLISPFSPHSQKKKRSSAAVCGHGRWIPTLSLSCFQGWQPPPLPPAKRRLVASCCQRWGRDDQMAVSPVASVSGGDLTSARTAQQDEWPLSYVERPFFFITFFDTRMEKIHPLVS